MNFIRNILLFAILIALVITCSNTQSIREEYVSKPNKIEQYLIDTLLTEEE